MSKKRTIIDFEIIWKKLHRVLPEKEDQLLDNWLGEDKKHRNFYQHAEKFFQEGSQFRNVESDTDMAWKQVNYKTNKIRKNVTRIATVVSSVAASVLIVATLFYFANENNGIHKLAEQYNSVKPGTDKAVLILSDGSKYQLDASNIMELKDGGSEIHSTGARVTYSRSKKQSDNLRYNTLEVPRGGKFFLELSDGTRVWLNSESKIKYPAQFSDELRTVELTGEAYFEVTRNEYAPFLVSSGTQVVKVLGTQFNISSYAKSNLIFTTLVEGSVEVYEKGNPENKCMLKPNEQSVFSKKDLLVDSRMVDPTEYIGWKNGRFIFNDEQLVDIMQVMARWYDFDFVFENESRREIRFTGNLPRIDNVKDILSKIEKTAEVRFSINNKTIIIR